ncbi:pentraxin fusion protein-like [Notolabrus celidotus]|uniref:pentraxin fusion protein-like n=1 Tax=Notolabrus celidotus TaxID=1203425 RepID=UPI00149023E1|nr:pentraxin fusion protein-like [Notolabrus celidotus]XP_034566949.1 pentraxin fusion protein-like [Notolabrus celidotus]
MKLVAVFLLIAATSVLAKNERPIIKTLVFPAPSVDSYVEMKAEKPLNMKAFTLCMRVATELTGDREVILFAYRTQDRDELNVWRERDGRLSLYMHSSKEHVSFKVPELGTLSNHLCFTWDSLTGATTLFMNGYSSVTKIYNQGYTVQAGGKVILGQDPDTLLGKFAVNQSFVGEISDVDLWDSVLSYSSIRNLVHWERTSTSPWANILNWETAKLTYYGKVNTVYHRV